MKFLFNIFTTVNQFFTYLKNKFKMHVFNLFDKFEQQFCQWFYFEINIKTIDLKNEYILPVFCCMRQIEHAGSLMSQIQKELIINDFIVLSSEITELTALEKDKKIKEMQLKLSGKEVIELRTEIYRLKTKKNISPDVAALFSEDEINISNLEPNSTYVLDKEINLRLNVIKNQGVPFNQIKDAMVVKIDKSKLY